MVAMFVLVGRKAAQAGLDAAGVSPAVDVAGQGVLGFGTGGRGGVRRRSNERLRWVVRVEAGIGR
jgi:hypothetical protein